MNSSLGLSTEAPKFSGAVGSQARGNGAGRRPETTQTKGAADPGRTGSQDAGASQSRHTGKQAEMRGRGTRVLPGRGDCEGSAPAQSEHRIVPSLPIASIQKLTEFWEPLSNRAHGIGATALR
jgi:hypothetical protein